jgi:hypothetical protein
MLNVGTWKADVALLLLLQGLIGRATPSLGLVIRYVPLGARIACCHALFSALGHKTLNDTKV